MVKPAENTAENNETKQFQAWNEEEYYNTEIIPLLKELSEKCKARNLPHLFHVMFSDDAEKKGVGINMHRHGRENTFDIFLAMKVAEGEAVAIPRGAVSAIGAGLLGSLLGNAKKED